jgi:hypothetical protein
MRYSKIALAALIIINCIATLFGFTSDKNKKFTLTIFFQKGIGLTRGPINGSAQLIQSEVTDVTNWVTSGNVSVTGNYLNSITFDQEPNDISDGISDGQYSKAEAIAEVWNEYVRTVGSAPQYQLPNNGSCFTPVGGSAICIGRDGTN